MLKNDVLDNLALKYAQGDHTKFHDLYDMLYPLINRKATAVSSRALFFGMVIPIEDFESHFCQAIWNAATGYDGRSHFMQRLSYYLASAEADVWRRYRSYIKGEVSYSKARLVSLDTVVNEDGETLADMAYVNYSVPGPEDEIAGKHTVLQAIEEFSTHNSKKGEIIRRLAIGWNGPDLAKSFGDNCYTSKFRADVCRTRAAFKKFILDRYADELSSGLVQLEKRRESPSSILCQLMIWG